jgi:hypothetical protein
MTDAVDATEVDAVLEPDIIPEGTVFHDDAETRGEVNPK